MSILHGTTPATESAIDDWYIGFQTKIIENLPRRIPKEIGLKWENRGDLMKQVLNEALMSKKIIRRLLFDARRYTITMTSNKTTEEMLAAGHYRHWSRVICSKNFPMRPMAQGVVNIEILNFGRVINSSGALQIAQEFGLTRPLYEHLFFLGQQHPDAVFRGDKILFLHEPWEDPFEKNQHLKKQILSLRGISNIDMSATDFAVDLNCVDDAMYWCPSDRFVFLCDKND